MSTILRTLIALALMTAGTAVAQQRVLDLPDVNERMQGIAFESAPTSPEEYDRMLRNQIELFTKKSESRRAARQVDTRTGEDHG